MSLAVLLTSTTVYAHGAIFNELSARYSAETNGAIAQKDAEVRMLEPGKPIERELAGGESHAYQLTLASGQYARVVVDQRGINIALTVFGPDGKKIIEADISGIGESESVSLISDSSASYRLEVRSPDKTAPRGHYEIKIEEMRAATEQDKSRVAADRLVAEGMQIYYHQTAESRRKAIEMFVQSLALWQSAKDPAREANTLYLIGTIYIQLGEKDKALDFCNRGLSLARAAGDRKDEAYLLDAVGLIYNTLGDRRKALEFHDQALPLRRAIGDRAGEADTLNYIAMAYSGIGERQRALDLFNEVRSIHSALGDRRREATALNNICVTYRNMADFRKALDFCNQALLIRRDLNDREGQATVINNIGTAYSSLGEYQKALDAYNQSLAFYKILANSQGEAIALNNIGWIYDALAEYQKALQFYDQALQLLRAIKDEYGITYTLNNIAVTHAKQEDYKTALEFHQQVLPLRRAVGDRDGEAITLNNIADSYAHLGERQKALDYYNQSLTRHRSVGNRFFIATALNNIGALYKDLGEDQKALDSFNESLLLRRAVGDRNGEAATLSLIARLERDRGNMAEARSRIEEALAAVESLRINVKSQQLRASFFASVRKYHEFNIDLLMRLHKERPSEGFDAAALQASEKARARSLLELLAEAHAEIRQGVDPALLERERTLRQMISDKAEHQIRLLSGKHDEEQATAAAKEIDALTTDYEQLLAQIRQTSPRYAALTQPIPLTFKEIQTRVLDAETLLLEYALGEENSFLWAVTPTSIKGFELPKRAEIEQAARRVYDALTARNQNIASETSEQRRKRLDQADADYLKTSAALSQMLLAPVASEMGAKRLLIVSEGVLQYVPFAALPTPMTTDSHPLVVDHEIVSLPSASVIALLRQETADRKPPAKTVAVLADPVFTSNDPRIKSTKSRAAAVEETSIADVKRSAAESGLGDLTRLRFSRQEADEIARFAAEGKRLEALDFLASRAVAMSADLGEYRIVHFATHALINNQHPELSGIVLSLVDEQGRPQNGFLRLYDIYNLKLGADLVVLSACQTALGKEIRGEGLVGLTRGFMYAGVPRVVASLWQIDDRATAELMRRFYEGVLAGGLRPAAALRAAQTSMWRDKRWRAPHYWAAFTLQGEWK